MNVLKYVCYVKPLVALSAFKYFISIVNPGLSMQKHLSFRPVS